MLKAFRDNGKSLKQSEALVWLFIWGGMWKNGRYKTTCEKIAKYLPMTERTIKLAVSRLIKKGWLQREVLGKWQDSTYRITAPSVELNGTKVHIHVP